MYQALEVQNIEEILPPPPQPQPVDPAMENSQVLMGQPLKAFPDQNHMIHMSIHVSLLQTPLIQQNPQAQAVLYAHIQEHVGMEAHRRAKEQIQQAVNQVQTMAKAGAVDPNLASQQIQQAQAAAQDPNEYNSFVALLQQQVLSEILPQMVPPQPDPMADPLVQIRQQELQTKQQENMTDAQIDAQKLEIERQKLEQKAAAEAARIELQEEIAEERNAVNRERIETQEEIAMRRNNGGQ